jgi:hypothetical protein
MTIESIIPSTALRLVVLDENENSTDESIDKKVIQYKTKSIDLRQCKKNE